MAHVFAPPHDRRQCFRNGTTTRRGSVSGKSALSVSVAFVAVCCSTLLLQALTAPTQPPSPLPTPASQAPHEAPYATTELFDALLARVSRSVRAAAVHAFTGSSSSSSASDAAGDDTVATIDVRALDLRVANVSIHRVRYIDSSSSCATSNDIDDANQCGTESADASNASSIDADASFLRRWTRRLLHASLQASATRKPTHVTSVVVTWDDSFQRTTADAPPPLFSPQLPTVTYEVQHYVHSWGLDGLWHPTNRKFVVSDAVAVVSDVPRDVAIAFRVRMRVAHTRASRQRLLDVVTPTRWSWTEIDGPWSDVVLLSPSRDAALAAIVAFLVSNKLFALWLLLCISASLFVLVKLFVVRYRASDGDGRTTVEEREEREDNESASETTASESDSSRQSTTDSSVLSPLPQAQQLRPRRTANRLQRSHTAPSARSSNRTSNRSTELLEQEIVDLRQELEDSEAEVRRLMVFRGYGIEALRATELQAVETELRATLQRIQRIQRLRCDKQQRQTATSSEDDDMDGVVADDDAKQLASSTHDAAHDGRDSSNSRTSSSSSASVGRSTGRSGGYGGRRRLGVVFEGVSAAC